MTANWKQLLEERRYGLAKHEDSDGYFGFLSGHASLEPLLLKAIEALEFYSNPHFESQKGYKAKEALRQIEELE